MDSEISGNSGSDSGAVGEKKLSDEKAAAPSPSLSAVPAPGRVLRGRGLCHVKTGGTSQGSNDSPSSTAGAGRVLPDMAARGPAARKHAEAKDQNQTTG